MLFLALSSTFLIFINFMLLIFFALDLIGWILDDNAKLDKTLAGLASVGLVSFIITLISTDALGDFWLAYIFIYLLALIIYWSLQILNSFFNYYLNILVD